MVSTRQSMGVAVEDQQLCSASVILEAPGLTGLVEELDRGCRIADAGTGEGHEPRV